MHTCISRLERGSEGGGTTLNIALYLGRGKPNMLRGASSGRQGVHPISKYPKHLLDNPVKVDNWVSQIKCEKKIDTETALALSDSLNNLRPALNDLSKPTKRQDSLRSIQNAIDLLMQIYILYMGGKNKVNVEIRQIAEIIRKKEDTLVKIGEKIGAGQKKVSKLAFEVLDDLERFLSLVRN